MIVVKLKGGLGNQMFQYAAGRNLSLKLGKKFFLDHSSFDPSNRIPSETPRHYELGIYNFSHLKAGVKELNVLKSYQKINPAAKLFNRIFPFRRFISMNDREAFTIDELKRMKMVLLDGYFQSENYFVENASTIRHDFEFPEIVKERNFLMMKKLSIPDSVSVHVRRGDYVSNSVAFLHHGICSKDYYEKAIELMKKSLDRVKLYYFTDDVEWVRRELLPMFPGEIVSDRNRNAHDDMYLMAGCRHHIIANSSFSWWGAWLGGNIHSKIIAPLKWYERNDVSTSHLIPASWIRI